MHQAGAQFYGRFVEDIKTRIRTAQIKAALAANAELVLHYCGWVTRPAPSCLASRSRALVARRRTCGPGSSPFFLLTSNFRPGIHRRAEIRSDQTKGKRFFKGVKGEIMNLSVETKVAIAVATSFVVLMMGAMAQG